MAEAAICRASSAVSGMHHGPIFFFLKSRSRRVAQQLAKRLSETRKRLRGQIDFPGLKAANSFK